MALDRDRTQWVIRVSTNLSGFIPTHGARIVKIERFRDRTEYLLLAGDADDENGEPSSVP